MIETVVAVEPSQNPDEDEAAAAAIDVPRTREVDELEVARELVRQARDAGVALTGPGGTESARERNRDASQYTTKRGSHPLRFFRGNSSDAVIQLVIRHNRYQDRKCARLLLPCPRAAWERRRPR